VVHRTWQGCGVGRQLLAEVERRVAERGGRQIYIETSGRDQYLPTRRFYENHGYQVAAVLPDFYTVGDPKVIFVKRLCELG
jgi:ribosomal protein S18 acetylase RimI-like enzyme